MQCTVKLMAAKRMRVGPRDERKFENFRGETGKVCEGQKEVYIITCDKSRCSLLCENNVITVHRMRKHQ